MAPSKKSTPAAATAPGPQQVESLATVPSHGGLAPAAAPAWLQKKMEDVKGIRGFEEMDKEDRIFPRLVLCQGQTPFVQDGKAMVGDICDNLTGEVLVKLGERLRFIPVIMSKSRMFLKGINEGGGVLCRANDAQEAGPGGCGKDRGDKPTRVCADCVFKEWDDSKDAGDEERKPKCTLFYNIVGFLPDHGNRLMVWSSKSTGVRTVKRFLSICAATGVDFFAHDFSLFGIDAESNGFQFKQWDFQGNGFVMREDLYNLGERIYGSIKGKKFEVSTADLEEKEPAPSNEEKYEATLDEAATPKEVPTKVKGSDTVEGSVVKPPPSTKEEIPF